MQQAALLLGVMLLLLAFGLPIMFCIGLSSVVFLLTTGMKPLILMPQRILVGADSFIFLAIPLFTLAGYLMDSGGLSKRLVDFVNKAFGWFPGSMGTVTIICCAIFAALTGSAPATVAAIGAIMIPAMLDAGYTKETSAGLVAAGGALGPIIPPSITMIIYGAALDLSIPDMFIASVVPGIMIAIVLIITNTILSIKWGIKGSGKKYTAGEIWKSFIHAIGVLLLPVIVLGGIYGGIFTPTEAAAVCVVYSVFLGICYRELTLKNFLIAMKKTVQTCGMVMGIISVSYIFQWILAAAKIPTVISQALIPHIANANVYMLIIMILLFIIGALMDVTAAILILGPILVPIGISLGIDPLHLGVIYCINLCVGYITPPFGINLFTAVSTANVPFTGVVKGIIPFIIVIIAVVMIMAFVPATTLWLPSIIG